jgi:hypothetical protein
MFDLTSAIKLNHTFVETLFAEHTHKMINYKQNLKINQPYIFYHVLIKQTHKPPLIMFDFLIFVLFTQFPIKIRCLIHLVSPQNVVLRIVLFV